MNNILNIAKWFFFLHNTIKDSYHLWTALENVKENERLTVFL